MILYMFVMLNMCSIWQTFLTITSHSSKDSLIQYPRKIESECLTHMNVKWLCEKTSNNANCDEKISKVTWIRMKNEGCNGLLCERMRLLWRKNNAHYLIYSSTHMNNWFIHLLRFHHVYYWIIWSEVREDVGENDNAIANLRIRHIHWVTCNNSTSTWVSIKINCNKWTNVQKACHSSQRQH